MDRFRTVADLPRYIERAGETVFAAPYRLDNSDLDVLLVRTHRAAVDKLIDNELNEAWRSVFGTRGVRHNFVAASGLIGFAFSATPQVANAWALAEAQEELNKSHDHRDAWDIVPYGSQTELAVLIPILDSMTGLTYWYLPYVLNNFPLAVAAGREVFGYPKQFARFSIVSAREPSPPRESRKWPARQFQTYRGPVDRPTTSEGGARQTDLFGAEIRRWSEITVEAYDVGDANRVELRPVVRVAEGRVRGGGVPDDRQRPAPLAGLRLDIEPRPYGAGPPDSKHPVANRSTSGGTGVGTTSAPSDDGESEATDFRNRLMSDDELLFLKQFRDPGRIAEKTPSSSIDRACYQAAVRAHVLPDAGTPTPVLQREEALQITLPRSTLLRLSKSLFGTDDDREHTWPVAWRFSATDVDLNVTKGDLWWEA